MESRLFNKIKIPWGKKAHIGATGEGHAMVIIVYDDSKSGFRILNSWSTAWVDVGEDWTDYDFFLNDVQGAGYV